MIARGFKSVIWVATVGGAALSCYMVSLKVATERAELTKVERRIVEARRDIRTLQTELGTRGRMSQLEQWNAEVLALSAPTASQFLRSEVTLARFEQTEPTLDERSAQVRMASAEAPAATAAPAAPVVQAVAPPQHAVPPQVRRASFASAALPVQKAALPAQKAAAQAQPTKDAVAKTPAARPGEAPARPKPAAAQAKLETKTAAKGVNMAPAAKAAKGQGKVEASSPAKAGSKSAPAASGAAAAAKPRSSRIDSKLAAEIKSAGKGQGSGGN